MASKFSLKPNNQNPFQTQGNFNQLGGQPTQNGILTNLWNQINTPFRQAPQVPGFAQADIAKLNQTSTPLQPSTTQNPVNKPATNADMTSPVATTSTGVDHQQGMSQEDISKMINDAMLKQGQNPAGNQMQGMSSTDLQGLMGMIQSNNQQQQKSYMDILSQARQDNNVPQLQQQFTDATKNYLGLTQGLRTGEAGIAQIPSLTGFQQSAREQAMQKAANPLIDQAQIQQQLSQQQLGLANTQAQNTLGAAQAGGQLGLQQSQLGAQTGLGFAQIGKGQFQSYFNPITGQPGTFNQNTGQFQQFGGQGQPQGGIQQGGQDPMTSSGQPIPPNIQNMGATDTNGTFYINADKAPAGFNANAWGTANGVPVLNSGDVAAIRGLDATKTNLARLGQLAEEALSPGTIGRLQGFTSNEFDKLVQNKEGQKLTAMDTFRESAIKQIQSLASGATGLRINQQVIDTAVSNLPNTRDNIETARVKLNYVNQLLDTQRTQILPTSIPNQGQGGAKSSGTGSLRGWF